MECAKSWETFIVRCIGKLDLNTAILLKMKVRKRLKFAQETCGKGILIEFEARAVAHYESRESIRRSFDWVLVVCNGSQFPLRLPPLRINL